MSADGPSQGANDAPFRGQAQRPHWPLRPQAWGPFVRPRSKRFFHPSDAADALPHFRVAVIFDGAGARDRRTERLGDIDDDAAGAAYIDDGVLTHELVGAHFTRTGYFDHVPCKRRLERARSADTHSLRLDVVKA